MKSRATFRRTWAGMTVLCGVALALMAAPGAHATTPKPLKYQDSDGPGQMIITELGPDPATGGSRIQVQLSQNGRVYSGSGYQLRLYEDPPNVSDRAFIDLVVFTLRDPFGRAFLFRGKVQTGGITGRLIGSGRYEQAGTGSDIDQWSLQE
jgi:hypothetical protein